MIFYQTMLTILSGYPVNRWQGMPYNTLISLSNAGREKKAGPKVKLMFDSGAFSNLGCDPGDAYYMTLDRHIKCVQDRMWLGERATFIQLDEIGNMDKTREQYHIERDAGLPVLPVVSCYGYDIKTIFKEIDYYLGYSDYLLLGGIVPLAKAIRYEVIKRVWKRYEYNCRIHLLGVGPFGEHDGDMSVVEKFYSCDTARIVVNLRSGAAMRTIVNGKWVTIDFPAFLAMRPKDCPEWLLEDMIEWPPNLARHIFGCYSAHRASQYFEDNPNPNYDKFLKSDALPVGTPPHNAKSQALPKMKPVISGGRS